MRALSGAALLLLAGVAAPPPAAAQPAPISLGSDSLLPPPPAVAREFRAAWITPVRGNARGDWPSSSGLSADEQRAELRALLDCARDAGLNAVVLHVRTAADALYPTTHAPWSAFLSGRSGVAPEPAYDPLAFAVAEAHARGLQLHAWFNPFRAMLPNFSGAADPSHVTRAHPEWVRRYGSQTWIDPGEPAARRAVLAAILDVVQRYDVDGVHLDDYFYPYHEVETVRRRVGKGRRARVVTTRREIPFPDDATWRRHGAGRGWSDRAAWRRANVDALVRDLYAQVKREKPWVLVGLSPFGIWRSGVPAGVTGLDAYDELHADARRWLREGWADYLAPQLYWPVYGEQDRFRALDAWWRTQNVAGRHVWPGLNTARVGAPRQAWPAHEIFSQVTALRRARDGGTAAANRATESQGHVHFRIGAVCGGDATLAGAMREALYREPAVVPAAPWLDARRPAVPALSLSPDGNALRVAAGDATPVAWWLVQWRDADGGAWSTRLRHAEPGEDVVLDEGAHPTRVAVTAIGRSGVAGESAQLVLPARLSMRGE